MCGPSQGTLGYRGASNAQAQEVGRTVRRKRPVGVLVIVIGLVGCSSAADPSASMRSDLMRVEPTEVRAGELAELHFPEETLRGEAFVLEERLLGSWRHRYWLKSALGESTVTPSWAPAEEDFDWDDVGIEGPGPDRILLPDSAEPGEYRVCTAGSRSSFCAGLTIVH
jgi:hypothetical protein